MIIQRCSMLVAIALLSVEAVAATSEPPDDMKVNTLLGADYAAPAPINRSLLDASPQIQISAGKDDKSAALKWGWQAPNGVQVNAKFSVPWNDSGDPTILGDLDGLAHARKLEFAITRILNPSPQLDRLDLVCDKAKRLTGLANAKCGSDLYSKLDNQSRREVYAAYFGPLMPIWNVGFAVGEQDFKHFDSTLTEQKDRKVPWSVSADLALVSAAKRQVYAFGYRRETSYMDDKTQAGSVCTPASDGDTSHLRCKNGFMGPPEKDEKNIVYVEWRLPLNWLALAPRVSYDFNKDGLGVDLPVYVFRSTTGAFTGGLRAGWTQAEHDVTLSVFIGAELNTYF